VHLLLCSKECQPFTYVRIDHEFGKPTVCYSDFDKNYTLGFQQNRHATMIWLNCTEIPNMHSTVLIIKTILLCCFVCVFCSCGCFL